jgi:inhibitor of KinA sporulation pathway (predicted exonuclease)
MSKYLCVLDFEATCWKDQVKPTQEIIEFPSVLYELTEDNEVKFISEFAKYVRPILEPALSDFCTSLTGITQEQVNQADTIEVVYKEHHEWLRTNTPEKAEIIIITCGAWDLKTMLPKEISNKKLPYYSTYKSYINIKDEFEYFYKVKAGGMVGMLNFLGLELEGRHHSGIDDTRNIAKIMLKLISDGHTDFQINKVFIKKN